MAPADVSASSVPARNNSSDSRTPRDGCDPLASSAGQTAMRRKRSAVSGNNGAPRKSDSASWPKKVGRYVSRRRSSQITTSDLPLEFGAIGFRSFWAFFWIFLFGIAPFCHVYIGLIVLHELCLAFDSFQHTLQNYGFAWLDSIATALYARSSRAVEVWCLLEALFYLVIRAKIAYLQTRDPLEASLSSAPLLDPIERRKLWNRMVECEVKDPVSFLRGWFFDAPLEQISRYDVFDFICWSMFDGRNPEHLTMEECRDLEDFVQEMEWIISLQLYGQANPANNTATAHDNNNYDNNNNNDDDDDEGIRALNSSSSNATSTTVDAGNDDGTASESTDRAQNNSFHSNDVGSGQYHESTDNCCVDSNSNGSDALLVTQTSSGQTTKTDAPSIVLKSQRVSSMESMASASKQHSANVNVASPLRQRWHVSTLQSNSSLPEQQSHQQESQQYDHDDVISTATDDRSEASWSDDGSFESYFMNSGKHHPRPKQIFRFRVDSNDEHANDKRHRTSSMDSFDSSFGPTLSHMYDSFRHRYDQFQRMVEHADFHPIQDFVRFMEETAIEIHRAEEAAYNRAQDMYTSLMRGSQTDELPRSGRDENQGQSDASSQQSATNDNNDIDNSDENSSRTKLWTQLKDTRLKLQKRFETAKFWSAQRKALQEQLRGNRAMLDRMREMSYAVPAKQMAALMRNITEGHHALERTEHRAKEAFWHATSILYNSSIGQTSQSMARNLMTTFHLGTTLEPKRYAKYSSDPLLGIAAYPLGMHALVLGCSEIPLRIMLRRRGFERRCVGPVSYYYHPGKKIDNNESSRTMPERSGSDSSSGLFGKSPYVQSKDEKIPLVFVHGIGIGIIFYMPLVDRLLETGRPILLPEIPYVSGFRPWQGPNSVLSPAVVVSTMTAMLAIHGFKRGTFIGHSYGTSWLSYMCKYAKTAVAALLFLDPICFCLHYSRLTKQFVYHRPDPGTSSFMVRTDIIVNWTIQRSFPWAWIILFVEQLEDIPCTVFLSDKDALVPADKVESYLLGKGTPSRDFTEADDAFFRGQNGDLNACIFRGHYHGQWAEEPSLCVPVIGAACDALCEKVEQRMSWKRME